MGEAPFDQDAPGNLSGADWLGDQPGETIGPALTKQPELTLEQVGALWHVRLQNDRQWVDKNGRVHDIKTMDAGHRDNVRAYLRRHATRIQWAVDMYVLSSMPKDADTWGLDDVVDEMAVTTPLGFLYQTPLYQALVAADL